MILIQCAQQNCSSVCDPTTIAEILISAFLAILFIQSGLDKLNDWKGNLDWQKEHFSKSFLKNTVPLLFTTLTLLEFASGTLCVSGIISSLVKGCNYWMYWGNVLSCITIICLFFGQRVAKDYPGAASLTGYFIITIAGIYLSC
jgi:uncharacterized membrane protein YphA (DoxX/SURF4 family)